jgi:CHASE1-domain containing sensor protein
MSTDRRRKDDNIAVRIAGTTLLLVVGTTAYAQYASQSQEVINATLLERNSHLTQRIDNLEWYLRSTTAGVIGNLIAYIFTVRGQARKRY